MMRRLRADMVGDDVAHWQAFLTTQGHYQGSPDGVFGAHTQQATKGYQTAHCLEADGLVGGKTLAAAINDGFEATTDDPTLDGATMSLGDAWEADLPPDGAELFVVPDPRVKRKHDIGQLPCPPNPAPPVGWAYWAGAVSAELAAFASEIENDSTRFPMGSFVQAVRAQQRVAARVEWHDYKGRTGEHGCFRGTNLFRAVAAKK